jgi:hypothetical protein
MEGGLRRGDRPDVGDKQFRTLSGQISTKDGSQRHPRVLRENSSSSGDLVPALQASVDFVEQDGPVAIAVLGIFRT